MGNKYSFVRLNVSPEDQALITDAARLKGVTPKAFIKEEARKVAASVLCDQRAFTLSQEEFDRLCSLLANPPPPNAKLRDLMTSPAPWA